jgi:hypothetical protein
MSRLRQKMVDKEDLFIGIDLHTMITGSGPRGGELGFPKIRRHCGDGRAWPYWHCVDLTRCLRGA